MHRALESTVNPEAVKYAGTEYALNRSAERFRSRYARPRMVLPDRVHVEVPVVGAMSQNNNDPSGVRPRCAGSSA